MFSCHFLREVSPRMRACKRPGQASHSPPSTAPVNGCVALLRVIFKGTINSVVWAYSAILAWG